MAKLKHDLTGQRFKRLVAVRWQTKKGYFCRCDCGNEVWVKGNNLGKHTWSCGCLYRETRPTGSLTHGLSRKGCPEYHVWAAMKARCANPRVPAFCNYGGRGIKVCERWLDFTNFYADMGSRPSANHSLDRIDNDGNYEPGNCRWATRSQQNSNQRPWRSRLHKEYAAAMLGLPG